MCKNSTVRQYVTVAKDVINLLYAYDNTRTVLYMYQIKV